MKRINHVTSASDLFGSGKPGFTGGSVSQQIARTVVTPEWANDVQEELSNAAESLEALDASNRYQVLTAIRQESDLANLNTLTKRVTVSSFGLDAASGTNGSIVITCSSTNLIYSAPDGWTFTARSMGSGSTNALNAVAAKSPNLFCGVGLNGEIQTSDANGVNWTKQSPAGGYADTFNDVERFGSMWIAVGAYGELQTSDSAGVVWTKRTVPVSPHFTHVAVNGSVAIVGGNDGTNYFLLRSTDGITWTLVSSGTGLFGRVQAIPGGFIAFNGPGITAARVSRDYGLTWYAVAATNGGSSLNANISPYSGLMTQVGISRVEGWDYRRSPNGTNYPVKTGGIALGDWLKRTKLAWVGSCQNGDVYVSNFLPPF